MPVNPATSHVSRQSGPRSFVRSVALVLLGIAALGPLAACEPSIGDACETNIDCPSGTQCDTTAPDGYCFMSGCEDNRDCPDGAVCVEFDAFTAFCMDWCSGNSDCRSGYVCRKDVGSQAFCYVAVPAEESPFARAVGALNEAPATR